LRAGTVRDVIGWLAVVRLKRLAHLGGDRLLTIRYEESSVPLLKTTTRFGQRGTICGRRITVFVPVLGGLLLTVEPS
jgi:hypothetical protein